jgi:transposase
MFVRRKLNKTGTVSVQVISKRRGQYKVLQSFGIGRTEIEIVRLEEKARQFIREQSGLSSELFVNEEELKLENFISTLSNNQLQVIGPELIFGRLYEKIGYGAIHQELFRHLVITRLFNPGSKLKTIDYQYRYQGISYSSDKIYRFLDALCHKRKDRNEDNKQDIGIKKQVEQITFNHTLSVLKGKIKVVFYDMTTLYFESSDEDDLRKTGFSKDGKHQCPQIFLGLLVASGGNPIGYQIYEGNIFEGNTFIPALQEIEKKYDLGKPTVIADSGLLSKKNIEQLEKSGYKYILGARPKNESDTIKERILAFGLKDGENAVIRKDKRTRLIVSMTDKRASKDAHNRERGLERLRKKIQSGKLTKASINNKGYNKYLKMEGEISISIDMDKYEADALWDGIKGYLTNTGLSVKNVISNYANLWYIERAFRMNKTDLRIRPVYHRLRNRIEGHICICFTAYCIMLETERMLKYYKSPISLVQAQEITKNMYQLSYHLPYSKKNASKILNMDNQQQMLYDMVMKWTAKRTDAEPTKK